MTEYREATVPLTRLLLDPNNYRFHDDQDYVAADPERFHETGVQMRAYTRLREDGILQLKTSILRNGFLPVERMIVRPYGNAPEESFLVLEGNRRTAALRWIAEDNEAGVTIPEHVLATLGAVPVIVVVADDDPAFYEALMGVRHVSGIKAWGGYQRAKLVNVLRAERGLESADIAGRLAMTTHEVNRRYRAFQALSQMQADENYGDYAKPDLYPIFHEAVSQPVVRDWLGWDEPTSRFTNEETLQQFYQLISPSDEDEEEQPPKITSFSQVRELSGVLQNTEAKRVLLDPQRAFLEAAAMVKREELARTWKSEVASVIVALRSIGIAEFIALSDEDVAEVERLRDVTIELLENYRKLNPQ